MKKIAFCLLALMMAACSHKNTNSAPPAKASSAATAPAAGAGGILVEAAEEPGFRLRPFTEETLANGLRVIFLQDSTLPKMRIAVLVGMGSINDPKGQEGLSFLTTELIEDGTTKMNSAQVADELGFLAADYSVSMDQEKTFLSVSSLTAEKEKTLSIFSQLLFEPSFADREVARRKSQLLAQLKKLSDNPGHYADLLFEQTIYPGHPYGKLVSGTPSSVTNLSRSDLVRQYFKFYRPENSMIAVSGDFDDTFKDLVRKTFGKWSGGKALTETRNAPSESNLSSIRLVNKKGLQQSQIRIGSLGISRRDPDHLPLRLANLILGGAFESRLNLKIRDELGLTYSISSQFDEMREGGAFEISTFSRNEKTSDVIKQTRLLVEEFVKKGITSKELDSAKMLMVSQFPTSVETPDETAASLLQLRFYGIPDSYLNNYQKNVNKITVSQVNEAIRKHLRPDQLKVVVFADESQVGDWLRTLGDVKVEAVEF